MDGREGGLLSQGHTRLGAGQQACVVGAHTREARHERPITGGRASKRL